MIQRLREHTFRLKLKCLCYVSMKVYTYGRLDLPLVLNLFGQHPQCVEHAPLQLKDPGFCVLNFPKKKHSIR